MATGITGGNQTGVNSLEISVANPGSYRDVYGFDNAPDNTNLPKIYEREVTIFGNRTLTGFLRMIGSEMPTNSREIRWAEQDRLHIAYGDVRRVAATSDIFTIYKDGTQTEGSATAEGTDRGNRIGSADHAVRVGDKVILSNYEAATPVQYLAYVSAVSEAADAAATSSQITLKSFHLVAGSDAGFAGLTATDNIKLLVVGSEFAKGTGGFDRTVQPAYKSYTNNTTILKDTYTVNGSDANQIGWVEIADENGVQGKYWYIKGQSEAMSRFEDYLETALLEDRKSTQDTTGGVATATPAAGVTGIVGSEGLFSAIKKRGLSVAGGISTGGGTASGDFLFDLDLFVKAWDKEGNIEENVWYLNRTLSLNFDNGMAAQNNGTSATTTSWGLFNNSKEMGLDLGFQSVRRGSYDIYKKDWKYLNQVDGRAQMAGVSGVSVPMGSKSVYDQYGANLQSPFASIHYLAGPQANRKMKTWVHGGAADANKDENDALNIQMLSERCICVKGANNFAIFV